MSRDYTPLSVNFADADEFTDSAMPVDAGVTQAEVDAAIDGTPAANEDLLQACFASGQMSPAQAVLHVTAEEMLPPVRRMIFTDQELDEHVRTVQARDLAYAQRLVMSTWRKHYANDGRDFGVFDTMSGVLSQLDNMLTGLTRRVEG